MQSHIPPRPALLPAHGKHITHRVGHDRPGLSASVPPTARAFELGSGQVVARGPSGQRDLLGGLAPGPAPLGRRDHRRVLFTFRAPASNSPGQPRLPGLPPVVPSWLERGSSPSRLLPYRGWTMNRLNLVNGQKPWLAGNGRRKDRLSGFNQVELGPTASQGTTLTKVVHPGPHSAHSHFRPPKRPAYRPPPDLIDARGAPCLGILRQFQT